MKHQKKASVAANFCLYQSSAKSNLQANVEWVDMITLKWKDLISNNNSIRDISSCFFIDHLQYPRKKIEIWFNFFVIVRNVLHIVKRYIVGERLFTWFINFGGWNDLWELIKGGQHYLLICFEETALTHSKDFVWQKRWWKCPRSTHFPGFSKCSHISHKFRLVLYLKGSKMLLCSNFSRWQPHISSCYKKTRNLSIFVGFPFTREFWWYMKFQILAIFAHNASSA